MYQQVNFLDMEQIKKMNDDGSISTIPADPANTDYQAYLEWLAEGNQPEVVEL